MARKNLLKGLMDAPETKSAVPPAPPRSNKGAIGAVSKSIADLKTRAIADIDPALIDDGGLPDRLDGPPEDHAALVASIRDYGQQVPILVRPSPTLPERYEVVYGRRRLAALKELGLPAKAMIRDLDDQAVIMAQGQENSARKDLSFIEKALFAKQMEEAGYDRRAMCDALHIDKTVISRMLGVVTRIPYGAIEAIGPAPSIGRDRWIKLSEAFGGSGLTTRETLIAVTEAGALGSDARFEVVFKLAQSAKTPPAPKQPATKTPLRTGDGKLGEASWTGGRMTLTLDQRAADGFDEWLVDNINEIHAQWKKARG